MEHRKVRYRNAAFPQKKRGEMLISAHPVSSQALEREIEVGRVNHPFAVRNAQHLIGQLIDPEAHLSRSGEHEPVMHRALRCSRAPRIRDPSQSSEDSFKDVDPAEYKQATPIANGFQRHVGLVSHLARLVPIRLPEVRRQMTWDHAKNSIRAMITSRTVF